jgi:hypothetical protein
MMLMLKGRKMQMGILMLSGRCEVCCVFLYCLCFLIMFRIFWRIWGSVSCTGSLYYVGGKKRGVSGCPARVLSPKVIPY